MLRQFLLAAMITAAVPAAAQVATSKPAKDPAKDDLNRVICEREEVTGTRLGAHRVCLTVLQWQEKRREHRESTERVQRTVNMTPSG